MVEKIKVESGIQSGDDDSFYRRLRQIQLDNMP